MNPVPAGDTRKIVEIAKILNMPDVREKLGKQLGMTLVGSTPDKLAWPTSVEIPRSADLVKTSGAKP